MLKYMLGLQIFILLTILTGTEVKAEIFTRCVIMAGLRFNDISFSTLPKEESLNAVCRYSSAIFNCFHHERRINFMLRNSYGAEDKGRLSDLFKLESVMKEICTEGTELHEDVLHNYWCFGKNFSGAADICKRRGEKAFEIFSKLQTENVGETKDCLIMAYSLACLGAEVKKKCDEHSYNTVVKILKKLGVLRRSTCHENKIQYLKKSFIDSLSMVDSEKSLYRDAFELRKKRK